MTNPNSPPRSSTEQRAEAASNSGRFGERPPARRHYPEARCEGPGCQNIVAAGFYNAQRTRSFCSDTCRNRDAAAAYVVGVCACGCGKDILGRKDQVGEKRFCDEVHRYRFVREKQLGPTASFRPLVEEYMSGDAKNNYKRSTLPTVQTSIAKFFRYAATHGIADVKDVRPSTITAFIAHEQERGAMCRTYVGHLSSFFRWLIEEERYDRVNPIIPHRHYQNLGDPNPRPYTDHELAEIWSIVEASGKYEMMLAFAIGEECGLRIGEVANIRLQDVDLTAQKIFVRLPTKNNCTRSVPFHEKVRKYLTIWLAERSPLCTTDHLLHNQALRPFDRNQLDQRFKKLLRHESEPASSFHFHRLRHTWATRLMNNGMELAVLKELGGWKKWSSMQCYIRVLEATVRQQYEIAYKKLQETQESSDEETMSLLDFALIDDAKTATTADSAT